MKRPCRSTFLLISFALTCLNAQPPKARGALQMQARCVWRRSQFHNNCASSTRCESSADPDALRDTPQHRHPGRCRGKHLCGAHTRDVQQRETQHDESAYSLSSSEGAAGTAEVGDIKNMRTLRFESQLANPSASVS